MVKINVTKKFVLILINPLILIQLNSKSIKQHLEKINIDTCVPLPLKALFLCQFIRQFDLRLVSENFTQLGSLC